MRLLPLLAVALLALGAAPSTLPLLRDQVWTAPGDRLAYTLTHAPAECLALPDNAAMRTRIEIGRALFRSPALLGGPAARTGLSCNACHPNGHRNAQFFLPELTDRPGAADVTAEWASAVRGDGIMNPRPIPDLVNVATKKTFGSHGETLLARFVSRVIEEEFQGAPPPPGAFDGLLAYLQALSGARCPSEKSVALTLEEAAGEVRQAVATARDTDAATASVLLLAGQEALGRIAERLPGESFRGDRDALQSLARALADIRASGAQLPAVLEGADAGWAARFDEAIARIAPRVTASYFDQLSLAHALGATAPP